VHEKKNQLGKYLGKSTCPLNIRKDTKSYLYMKGGQVATKVNPSQKTR